MGVVATNFVEFGSLLFEVTKNFQKFFVGRNMLRKMYQGGSSRKQGPKPAMREPGLEPPREAQVRPCEWSSENFMDRAGIKEEFEAYVRNADLEGFMSDKCLQHYYLTDSFVRRFTFSSSCNSHTVLFDLYDKSYTMDLEDFSIACKLLQ